MSRVDDAFCDIDRWVSSMSALDGGFVPPNFSFENRQHFYGMQQVRSEIFDFCRVLESSGISDSVLEIGLGTFGSTHRLWLQMVDVAVVTIEKDVESINRLMRNMARMPLGKKHGAVIHGSSTDPHIVAALNKCKFGCLFIDGCHRFESVLMDWLLYRDSVREGGIVAFHDTAIDLPPLFGVSNLMRTLRTRGFDVRDIIHCGNVGISYYRT